MTNFLPSLDRLPTEFKSLLSVVIDDADLYENHFQKHWRSLEADVLGILFQKLHKGMKRFI